jgi:hypothetical protein
MNINSTQKSSSWPKGVEQYVVELVILKRKIGMLMPYEVINIKHWTLLKSHIMWHQSSTYWCVHVMWRNGFTLH